MHEGQIHDAFIAWLNKHGVTFIHHRMDRKSGIQEGWPDFTVLFMSRVVCVEIKTPSGKLTKAQVDRIREIETNGNAVVVARSIEECVEAVRNILCEKVVRVAPPEVKPVEPGADGLFIADFFDIPTVFEGNSKNARVVRTASTHDLATLPRSKDFRGG